MHSLADKTLVMVVGPSSVGKSTLMNEVVRLDPEFCRVKSFTTRPPRPNDEQGQYFYLTPDQVSERADIITDVVYPTTGFHYGTIAESYALSFNLLDTLAHSVDEYKALPFARTVTVSLTTDPESWMTWLKRRFPNGGSDMNRRLEEAVQSITWSLSQTSGHHWLVNRPDDVHLTARMLISLTKSQQDMPVVPLEATQLLATAKNLLSYE